MAYNEGFQTGYQATANPFSAIIKKVDEAAARKYAEKKKEEEDISELRKAMVTMGMQHEYDVELKNLEEAKDIKTEIIKGLASGELETTDDISAFLENFGVAPKSQLQSPMAMPQGSMPSDIPSSSTKMDKLPVRGNEQGTSVNPFAPQLPNSKPSSGDGVLNLMGMNLKQTGKKTLAERKLQLEVAKLEKEAGMTPELAAEEEGRVEGIKESKKQSYKVGSKLSGVIKSMDSLRQQFDEALPSEGRSTAGQRINGILSSFGAKTGVKENPELLALLKNSKPIAVGLIKDLGETGTLSKTDIDTAVNLVQMDGLTEEERAAGIKQFLENALSKMDYDVKQYILSQEDIVGILKGLKVDINKFKGMGTPTESSDVRQTSRGNKVKFIGRTE